MCNVVRDFNTSLLITEKEQTKKVGNKNYSKSDILH